MGKQMNRFSQADIIKYTEYIEGAKFLAPLGTVADEVSAETNTPVTYHCFGSKDSPHLSIGILVGNIKEVAIFIRACATRGYRQSQKPYDLNQIRKYYLVGKDGKIYIDVSFSGVNCHYVPTGEIETTPKMKLVCDELPKEEPIE